MCISGGSSFSKLAIYFATVDSKYFPVEFSLKYL